MKSSRFALLALPFALLGGVSCKIDSGLSSDPLSQIAVVAGDFDDVAAPLKRYVVPFQTYEGIISTAVWDPEWDHESAALKSEGLLLNEREMLLYDAVFVASGTRGFGEREYNGLDPDDQLVTDPVVAANARAFVENGGRLLLTDWSYELFEAAWPEVIDFLGDDLVPDSAQKGRAGEVVAQVSDPELAEVLGSEQLTLTYDYSNWAIPEAVGDAGEGELRVLLRGPASYIELGDTEPTELEIVPLAFAWQPPGARGKVLFTTFHVDAQPAGVIDELIAAVLGDFKEASGESVVVE